jgi:hypothetical protein
MLIAEDLLLLLTDDSSGRHVIDGNVLDVGLAGAVLLELAMAQTVEITGSGGPVRRGQVVVRAKTPLLEPVLDEALHRIAAAGPRRPRDLLPLLVKGLRPVLLARLVERGLLRIQERLVLGIFPARSWPAVDSVHKDRLRAALDEVLMTGKDADPHELALVSLLLATGALTKVVGGPPAREVKRRAEVRVEGEFAGMAVREAIPAVQDAVTVVIASGDSGDGGGGDGS